MAKNAVYFVFFKRDVWYLPGNCFKIALRWSEKGLKLVETSRQKNKRDNNFVNQGRNGFMIDCFTTSSL